VTSFRDFAELQRLTFSNAFKASVINRK
jgi:hypothetical protein